MVTLMSTLYGARYDFPFRVEPPKLTVMVAAIPRTGSTFLCTALWRTGVMGAPMEYLNLRNRKDDMIRRLGGDLVSYWRHVKEVRTSENGTFSFKAFLQDFRDASEWTPDILPYIKADKVIYLRRRDKMAQAVSYSRAHQSGKWFADMNELRDCAYSEASVRQSLRWVYELEEGWEKLFDRKRCKPLRIYYEDLEDDPGSVVREILEFVGTEEGSEGLDIPMPIRQRDSITEEWIATYLKTSESQIERT